MGPMFKFSSRGFHLPKTLRHFIVHVLVFIIIPNLAFYSLKILHVLCAKSNCFFHCVTLSHATLEPCHVLNISFQDFTYLSMGCVHWVCTRPHNFTSTTRCTIRCVIMLKRYGGMFFSKRQNVMVASCFKSLIILKAMVFAQSLWNTSFIWMIASRRPLIMKVYTQRGKICCIRTW